MHKMPIKIPKIFSCLKRTLVNVALMQEAIQKAGGTQAHLDGAVRAGRVIKSGIGGLAMFYFPRKVFSKQTILKNQITAGEDKVPDDENAVEKFKDEMMKDDWDPYTLVAAGLDSLGQGNSMDATAMASLSPMASLGPTASLPPSSSLPKFTPSATGGISIHFKIPCLLGGLS